MNPCVLCGFKKSDKHHIVKRRENGSDSEDNLVYLCPNHHWLADFGTESERQLILNLILEKTGKTGKLIPKEKRILLHEKVMALIRENFPDATEKEFIRTDNYCRTKKWLLGRGCDIYTTRLLNKRAEILLIINKLNNELKKINA